MLGKLAYRNTKRNIKDYLIYLITVTASFSLIFAFNLVASSDEIVKLCSSMDAFKNSLFAVNILIIFVICFLINYTTKFMFEKRSKELGTYMLLGIKKKEIAHLVIIENILLGILAFVLAIPIGFLFSQFVSLVIVNLLGIPKTLFISLNFVSIGLLMANKKLSDEFGMSNIHMVMIKNGMSQKELSNMQKEIDKVDGVEWCLGMNSVIGSSIPSDMIPSSMKEMLQSDEYEMQFICSNYKSATEKVNKQINEINNIVKKYSPGSMVIGEAPLMNDLETVTNVDLRNVNIASIAAIFVIILIVFKSISLPVILVAVIEFAICVNMAVPYYTGLSLPFVASIVIGTIQLGATVDYAILMTSRYQKERINGKKKMEAIRIAHETSMQSIITSGLSFFAATIGIAIYSNIDMISAICTLLARGAVISTVAVIFILPAMFMIFDKLICKTTLKMGHLE